MFLLRLYLLFSKWTWTQNLIHLATSHFNRSLYSLCQFLLVCTLETHTSHTHVLSDCKRNWNFWWYHSDVERELKSQGQRWGLTVGVTLAALSQPQFPQCSERGDSHSPSQQDFWGSRGSECWSPKFTSPQRRSADWGTVTGPAGQCKPAWLTAPAEE